MSILLKLLKGTLNSVSYIYPLPEKGKHQTIKKKNKVRELGERRGEKQVKCLKMTTIL